MNQGIEREIKLLEKLGEKVEVVHDEIIIHNEIVPDFIAEAFSERIKIADTKNKYKITIKPA